MKTSSKKNKRPMMLQKHSLAIAIIIVISVCIIAGISCGSTEKVKYVPLVIRHDSIVIREVRDTIISYPKQTNTVVAVKKSRLDTDLAWSEAEISNEGLLVHKIENKGVIPSKVVSEMVKTRDSVPVPYEVKVELPASNKKTTVEPTFYHHFGQFALGVLIVGFLVLIAYAVIKKGFSPRSNSDNFNGI